MTLTFLLNKDFMGISCRKYTPEPDPRPFLILVHNPNEPLHTRNSYKK